MLTVLLDLAVPVVVGDKLDLAAVVFLLALGSRDDGEEFPVGVVDRFLKFPAQAGTPAIGVGRFDEVIRESEKEGTITGPHECFGRVGKGFVLVKAKATILVGLRTLAGAEGYVPLLGDFFESLGHARVIGGLEVIATIVAS